MPAVHPGSPSSILDCVVRSVMDRVALGRCFSEDIIRDWFNRNQSHPMLRIRRSRIIPASVGDCYQLVSPIGGEEISEEAYRPISDIFLIYLSPHITGIIAFTCLFRNKRRTYI
jgi:hypothetical protein